MADLVERLRDGAPLNTPDPRTFYSTGREGYTDYPRVGEQAAASRGSDLCNARETRDGQDA